MKIKLGSTVLADDTKTRATTDKQSGALEVADLKWGGPEVDGAEMEFEVQTSRPIGAKHVSLHDRGNASGALRFSATLQAGSLARACEAMILWPNACTHTGTLYLVDEGGTDRSLGEARIRSLKMSRVGVTVKADYVILYETGRNT